MAIRFSDPFLPMFGFDTHTRATASDLSRNSYHNVEDAQDQAKEIMDVPGTMNNLLKAVTYIPGLNILTIIVQAVFVHKMANNLPDAEKKKLLAALGGRIVCELVFGPLLLLVDVIKTAVDQHRAKQIIEEKQRPVSRERDYDTRRPDGYSRKYTTDDISSRRDYLS